MITYQNIDAFENLTSLVEFDEDDDFISSTISLSNTATSFFMKSSSRRSSISDISEQISHKRLKAVLFKFILVMKLWCEHVDLSRSKYASLREILRILELNFELENLSDSLSTFKRWIKEQLSLLNMWKKKISLKVTKLSFMRVTQKILESIFKSSTEYLYFFDFKSLFTRFLSFSEIRNSMHIDLNKFQDSAVEIWHSRVWNFSICITSEQYAYYLIFSEIHQDQFIFSFNFVQYSCLKKEWQCHQISSEKSHIKRVLKIACDFRRETITSEKILLKIQRVVIAVNVVRIAFDSLMNVNELLFIKNSFHYLSEDSICMSELNVLFNYLYESWIKTQMQVSWSDQLFIQRVLNLKKKLLWSLNQCHSIQAELKLATYTRQHFVQKFDKAFVTSVSRLNRVF